jgi:hypothetical protein
VEFHEYRTLWGSFKQHFPESTISDFYGEVRELGAIESIRGNRFGPSTANQAIAEQTWLEEGRPYFKIYPDMIHLLLKTKMDVPSQYLRCPFKSFCLRFPKGHQIPELTQDGYEIRAILIDESQNELDFTTAKIKPHRSIIAWMDFGEDEKNFPERDMGVYVPVVTYTQLKAVDDKSIEDCICRNVEGTEGRVCDEGVPITLEMTDACFRIAVAICFLATGADQIVEPDVLSKDLPRYIGSDDKALKKRLVEKAHRRGKKGWTVGREIKFPYHRQESHDATGAGRQLKYSHQRAAHFHAVRYGPNKSLVKVVFIRQLTVRPDLPPAPGRRGYKTKGGSHA